MSTTAARLMLALAMTFTLVSCGEPSPERSGSSSATSEGPPVSIEGLESEVVIQFSMSASISEVDRVANLISPPGDLARFAMLVDPEERRILIAGSPRLTDADRQHIEAALASSDAVSAVTGL